MDFADSINKFLNNFGRWRERDEVAELVEREIGKLGDQSTNLPITKSQYLTESGRGERLLQQGRAGQAEQVFRALLQRLEGAATEWGYEITVILRNIGLSLSAQGRPAPAADCYRRALGLAEGLKQTENLKHQVSVYHADLADTLTDSGHYAEAKQEYEKSLALAKEIDDNRQQGVPLGQLGTLAMLQGDLNEARQRYLEALGLFQRLGEDQMEAVAWHQLGMVAQEQRDWDEAERCYKKALTMRENYGDLALAATDCNQLAIVAKNAGRPQEAERWYLRAIELFEKVTDTQNLAKGLNNLASLYLAQNRLEEAETLARRALEIKATLDLSSEPWTTCQILAEIAAKRGQTDEARSWRRQEQESRLMFEANSQADTNSPNVREKADQWNEVVAGIVAVCQSGELEPKLGKFLDEMAGTDAWKNLVAVLHRILAGERGMELFDGLNAVDSAILRRVLKGVLIGEAAPSPRPSPERREREQEPEGGLTLPQLLELVERAANGDQELGGQLFQAFQQMTRADDPVMSTLGKTLLAVLVGERQPNLSGLPDELASAVRGLLGRLKH